MPVSSHVELTWEDLRALGAATAEPSQARADWVALMSKVPFDEINENTQRVMPAIFRNLRDHTDLPERDRMRGAFKYRWSQNTELLHGVRPVLTSFEEQGIDYRILKGAAVQAVTDGLGSRTMGDVDILISAADVDRVSTVMNRNGFRRGTHSACNGHDDASHHDALNYNLESCHVDIHVAEYKEPVRLLSMMMAAPAREVRAAGVLVRIPPAELLLLHAAVHGRLASGPTDFVQAVVDVAMLAPHADQGILLEAARRTGTVPDLLSLDDAVRAAGAAPLDLHLPRRARLRAQVEGTATHMVGLATESSSVARRLRARQRGPRVQDAVARRFNGRRHAYRTWLRLGQFAVVERAAVRAEGGFLPVPDGTWVSGTTVRPFEQGGATGLNASNVSGAALDWRFRVRLPGRQDHVRLTLESPALDTLDAHVFVNGRPQTRVVAGDPSTRDIYLRDVPESAEFSLRPLWEVCTQCYGGLDDLRVRIDVGDDAR